MCRIVGHRRGDSPTWCGHGKTIYHSVKPNNETEPHAICPSFPRVALKTWLKMVYFLLGSPQLPQSELLVQVLFHWLLVEKRHEDGGMRWCSMEQTIGDLDFSPWMNFYHHLKPTVGPDPTWMKVVDRKSGVRMAPQPKTSSAAYSAAFLLLKKSSNIWGFHKWWIPKIDQNRTKSVGFLWNILLKWMILRYPHDLGNLHMALSQNRMPPKSTRKSWCFRWILGLPNHSWAPA